MKSNQQNDRLARRKRLRRRRKKRWLILTPLLLLIIGVLAYGSFLYFKADSAFSESLRDIDREKSDLRETAVDPTKDNISILLMGVDTSEKREGNGDPRSDTMMLATLNKEEKSAKLVSIPRDSHVYIPYNDTSTRINHALAYGGPKASMETVERLFDVPVDYYVTINFEAFIDVVESINGITVDVPYELWEQNSDDEKRAIHLQPGKQKLNGEEALALARTRKYDNDIERGKRQQDIIKAIMDKTLSIQSVLKYDDIIENVSSNMQTNMTFSEMKSLWSYGLKSGGPDLETSTLKGYDSTGQGGMYLYELDDTDLANTKQELKAHLEVD